MAAKKRNHSERGCGQPKSMHFFRVILEDTLESGKLQLPKRFFRKHEKDLRNLNVVSLKVPSTGDVWEVRVTKCSNGEFWFEKGWEEFSSFYSIGLGDFIVFKWEPEKSQFQVLIFNKTTTEIQYPSKCPTKVSDHEEDDVQVKIMSELLRNKESTLSSPRPSKRMKKFTGEASSSKYEDHTDHALNLRLRGEYKSGGKLVFSESRPPQQCSNFVSKYPFFQTVIKRSCLNYGVLHLPRSFAKSNINMNCRKQILTLVTNGGQSWPVKLSCNLQSMKSNMYGGLSNFLKENFVRLGNLCTFELIDKKQMVFRVYIHRGKDDIPHADSHDFGCKKTCSTTISNAPRPGSEFAAKHPFFQATINKFTLLYKRLSVSRTFVKDNMNTNCNHQILSFETGGERSWPVKLVIYSNPKYHARLEGGLKANFLEENNVKIGDFCTFELVNRKNMVFRVSIRGSKDEGDDDFGLEACGS